MGPNKRKSEGGARQVGLGLGLSVSLTLLLLLTGGSTTFALDVGFSDPSAAFFIRQRPLQVTSAAAPEGGLTEEASATTSIILGGLRESHTAKGKGEKKSTEKETIHSERFAVLRPSPSLSVVASYGPFRTSQTVPFAHARGGHPEASGGFTAHLVTKEIPKDKPVLRVLFHSGSSGLGGGRQLCVRVIARGGGGDDLRGWNASRLTFGCSPGGRDSTCLAEATLPSGWWPPITGGGGKGTTGTATKRPKVTVSVAYEAYYANEGGQCGKVVDDEAPRIVQETKLGLVPLVAPRHGYRQLGHDDIVHMLITQASIFPNSKLFVPVFVQLPPDETPEDELVAIKIKCRSRSGIRLLSIESTSDLWDVSVEMNLRGTRSEVNIVKREDANHQEGPEELFNWLFSVDDREYETWTQGKLTFHVSYERRKHSTSSGGGGGGGNVTQNDENASRLDHYKLRARVDVKKDDAQMVVPIARQSELINLAVLNGRQVSQPLKVFIVSEAGQIADVTLHSSCSSKDDSALKVSSSCTSVYVDGSEARGALDAEVVVKYGSQEGVARVTVWMPELPLTVELSDKRLSQVKGWRALRTTEQSKSLPKKRDVTSESKSVPQGDAVQCRNRYQQTKVSVYARFIADDSDSGRKDFFPSRNTELDLTKLLLRGRVLRVSDKSVASLRGTVVEGLSPGRTEVQVVSPITGQVIGREEVRVTKNRESIVKMDVTLVAGLHLEIEKEHTATADPADDKALYEAKTTFSKKLSSKYQEGWLDIKLTFSDHSTAELRDINPNDFFLSVKSLEPTVLAFAPSEGARYPRVLSLGSGSGELLKVSLELPDDCVQQRSALPLADTRALVEILLENGKDEKSDGIQKVGSKAPKAVDMGDLGDDIALSDDQKNYYGHSAAIGKTGNKVVEASAAAAREGSGQDHHFPRITPVEVGMYVLLGVFCAAIAIFVASCFVYASRHGGSGSEFVVRTATPVYSGAPKSSSNGRVKSRSEQNAHDWVWLGKCTLDQASSVNTARSGSDWTKKSQRLSYVGSEINIIPNPRTDEYEAEVSKPGSPEDPPPPPPKQNRPPPAPPLPSKVAPMPRQEHMRRQHPRSHNRPPPPPPSMVTSGEQHVRRVVRQRPVPPRGPPCQRIGHPLGHSRLPPEYRPPRSPQMRVVRPVRHQQEERYFCRQQQLPVGHRSAATSPMTEPDETPETPLLTPQSRRANPIDSSTFTRRSSSREGVPTDSSVFSNTDKNFSAQGQDGDDEDASVARRPDRLSPLLPDPSSLSSPLRQSPASALPPIDCEEDEVVDVTQQPQEQQEAADLDQNLSKSAEAAAGGDGDDDGEGDGGDNNDDDEHNPDLDRPSPPRLGTATTRILENPFELTDEDSAPICPEEDLSPSHVFEASDIFTVEEGKSHESGKKASSPTFVEKLAEEDKYEEESSKKEGEENFEFGMDYEQLMAYFESLKESTA